MLPDPGSAANSTTTSSHVPELGVAVRHGRRDAVERQFPAIDAVYLTQAPDLSMVSGEFAASGFDGVTTIHPGDFIAGTDLFNPADITVS